MSMLKMAGTLAMVGGLATAGLHQAASAAEREVAAKKTLTVTIVGSTTAARNADCQYTAYVSGGTPPYNYSWIGTGLIDGHSSQTATYHWSTVGNKLIWVDVGDAASDAGSAGLGVMVSTTGSC